jgi:hypothetical protein
MMGQCRMLCINTCRRRTATFSGQEYMLMFKCGKRTLTKMETALKNSK